MIHIIHNLFRLSNTVNLTTEEKEKNDSSFNENLRPVRKGKYLVINNIMI